MSLNQAFVFKSKRPKCRIKLKLLNCNVPLVEQINPCQATKFWSCLYIKTAKLHAPLKTTIGFGVMKLLNPEIAHQLSEKNKNNSYLYFCYSMDPSIRGDVVLPFLTVASNRDGDGVDAEADKPKTLSKSERIKRKSRSCCREFSSIILGIISILMLITFVVVEQDNLETIVKNVTWLHKYFNPKCTPANCTASLNPSQYSLLLDKIEGIVEFAKTILNSEEPPAADSY